MDFYNLPKDLFQFCFMRAFLSLIDLCDEGDVVFDFSELSGQSLPFLCASNIFLILSSDPKCF